MSNPTISQSVWTAGHCAAATPRATGLHSRFLTRLRAMLTASRQRRDLAQLDDRTLHDIGVSRADVEREARRRFWDVDI